MLPLNSVVLEGEVMAYEYYDEIKKLDIILSTYHCEETRHIEEEYFVICLGKHAEAIFGKIKKGQQARIAGSLRICNEEVYILSDHVELRRNND